MAKIEFYDVLAACDVGSTWATAADITTAGKLVHFQSIAFNPTNTVFRTGDAGVDGHFPSYYKQLGQDVPITITGELSFGGQWIQLLAALFGAADTPAEQTASQNDYLHELVWQDTSAKFLTLAWKVESDLSVEIPSFKVSSFSITGNPPNVPTWTCTGIGSHVVYQGDGSPVNTATDLDGMSLPNVGGSAGYEAAPLYSSGSYLRTANFSSSTALNSSNDKQATAITMTWSRPYQTQRVLQGANSYIILEPRQVGKSACSLTLGLPHMDDAKLENELIEHWGRTRELMAEMFVDGSQIGTGNNASLKWRFSSIHPDGSPPVGYGPSAGTLMAPSLTYVGRKGTAAAAGMDSLQNMAGFNIISERSTTYV